MYIVKTISLAAMIMIAGVASMNASNSHPSSVLSGVIPIKIYPKPIQVPTQPRTPAYNPFYAELTQLGVMLVADSDWGEASVTLSSLEGDYYQTTFDMADGAILLPVNGNDGDSYTLTISIESGLDFEGEFVL